MELFEVFKALVSKNERAWDLVSDLDKEKSFFIFNRYFSKKYLEKSQLFNLKTIDRISSMNLWHYFIISEPYPNWFWSKGEKEEKKELPEKDYKLLLRRLKIKDIDLDYLIDRHSDFIKEELKFYKSIEKNK